MHQPKDRTAHACYTSCGALAGYRNSSMDPPSGMDPTTYCTMSAYLTMDLHITSPEWNLPWKRDMCVQTTYMPISTEGSGMPTMGPNTGYVV